MWRHLSERRIQPNEQETEPTSQRDGLVSTLSQVLDHFQTTTPGVLGCGIMSTEGYAIVAELPNTIEEQRVAAMTAAMLALGEQTTHEFERGALKRVLVEGQNGHIIVASAGQEALLSAVASKDARIGLILIQMERAAATIRQVIDDAKEQEETAEGTIG